MQTLDGIEDGTLTAVPQPDGRRTYATKIDVDDAQIDWTAPADVVDRQVRGCSPAPGRLDDLPRRAVQDQLGRRAAASHPPAPARSR